MTDTHRLVLVVDDHDDMRDMLCEALGLAGLKVAEARAGDEALEKAVALRPDLIVLDYSLPRLDGIDVTRTLKANDGTKAIPIILLTGRGSPADLARIESSGCDRFVRKPCAPDDLLCHIAGLLPLT